MQGNKKFKERFETGLFTAIAIILLLNTFSSKYPVLAWCNGIILLALIVKTIVDNVRSGSNKIGY